MPRTLDDIQLARELAARLELVLGPVVRVLRFSKAGWTDVIEENDSKGFSPALDCALQSFNRRSEQPFVWRHDGKLVVMINTCLDSFVPIVVGVVLPDQPETLICSLISAHFEALQQRVESELSKKQSEFFIDQVTQDFEELNWLRSANEYFDLCDSNHTIESIARECLPNLAKVIRAEAILFVQSTQGCKSSIGKPDWNRVIANGNSKKHHESCKKFLADSIAQLVHGPRVLNVKPTEACLADFPGLRNCIAVLVAKSGQVYGWILAFNKMPSQNAVPLLVVDSSPKSESFFGTFEASLIRSAANIMSSHARNLEMLEAKKSLLTGVVRAIINAIDAKDPYTCGHSDRVALYAKRIAARLGQSPEECERIYMAGLLHDVGKIGIPDSILRKPGSLTNEEYAIVKKHPEIGYTILKHLKQLDYVLPGVRHHHEAVNGKGYPAGLYGEAIPLQGRILAVADAYDAMTSDRPYRPGMPSEKAESILRAEAGKTWDADIVGVFLECLANEEIQTHDAELALTLDPNYPNNNLMLQIAKSIKSMGAQ
jgi:hypothetical protein